MYLNWTRSENEYQIEKGTVLLLLFLIVIYYSSNYFFENHLRETDYAAPKDAFQRITLGQKININSESLEGILAIPFMTPGMARDIVSFRENRGPIKHKADLEIALGRNKAKVKLILPYVDLETP